MMTNHCKCLETNDKQMELCPVNVAGEVRLPNPCPVYIFFYGFCYMWTSIVMEQNYIFMTFGVLPSNFSNRPLTEILT